MKIAMKNALILKMPYVLSFGIKRIWLFTLLVLAMFSSVFAQDPTLVWQANYGSNTNDYARNIIQTSDGGYLVVGSVYGNTADVVGSGYIGNSDGWVVKLNASGGIVWKKAYGTTGFEGLSQAIEVSDGYVLVGDIYSTTGSTFRLWYAKVSKTTGAIVWSQTYGSQSGGSTIIATPDGGFLIGGTLNYSQALLLKTNSSGTITATYSSHPNGGFWGRSITQIEKTSDNGYILLGSYHDANELGCYPLTEVPEKYDVWLCKLTSNYTFSWSKIYGGETADYSKDIVAAPDGNLFVLGKTPCTEGAASIIGPNNVGVGDWLMKTNSTGTIQDVVIVSVDLLDYTHTRNGIGLTCDNEIVLTGITGGLLGVSLSVEKMSTYLDYTYWTYYTQSSTAIDREGYDIISTSDNGYAVVGRYKSSSKMDDYLILKLSSDPSCGSNDFCSKAVNVSCGQFLQNQTTVGESNAINAYPCVSNGTFTGGDKVYKIVLTQTSELQVGLEILQSNKDLDLFLLGSDCNTITCLDKSIKPNVANGSNPFTNKEGIQKVLNAGTYYIVVDGYDASQASTFNIDFACGQLACTGATQLTCGIPYSSSTTSGANNVSIYNLNTGLVDDVPVSSGDPGKKFDVNNAGPERVHQFTINQQSTVTITLSNVLSAVDLELFLLNNCSTKFCIAKSVNPAGQNEVITMQLNAGTYYVVVDGFRNNAGSYTLNVDCGGCPPPVNNFTCNIIKCYYSGNSTNLQYTFTGTQNIALGYTWKITGNNLNVNGSSSNSFSYNFLNPGTYQVCYPYIKPDGCVEYCCINICVSNPFDCDGSITPSYSPTSNGWRFTLQGSGFTNIEWRNDATGQSAGTGYQSNLILPPSPCTGIAQSVSVTYFDGICYKVCCFRYYPCNPFDCGLITYEYDAVQSGYRFELNTIGGFDQSTISWTVDSPVSQSLGTGNEISNLLPLPVNCGEYWISVRFKDATGTWKVCCIRIYICNPFDCFDFGYNYVSANNGYQFQLNLSGATNISWTDDNTGNSLGTGATSSVLPIPPGGCAERTITVRYFWNNRWYICCRRVWLCNPFDCVDFTYNYVSANNGYQFQLNLSGATNISWTDDNTGNSLGTSAISNVLPIPPGGCAERTITVRYFWNNRWYICCRRVWLCNPFDCFDFAYNYVSANNGYQFQLNLTGATNISWTDDNTGTSLGNSATSSILPIPPGGCAERTITVRYFWNNRWYMCCRRVWLCNPFDCIDFAYNYVSANNGYQFQLNLSGATNIAWTDDNTGNSLGTSATSSVLPVPPGGCAERTITVRYFWNNRWYICCRRVWLCNPFDCVDFAYNYVSANNGYQFQLNLSGATNISWTDDNTGNSLGTSAISSVLPIPPGGCVERTITVRYFWNNRWYICCRKIWICNPNLCGSDINYVWQTGGMLNLSVNQANQNVNWKLENGQSLGNGNNITVPNPGNNSVVCCYFRGSDGVWKVCCVNIGTPPNPGTDLTFDIENDVCGSNNAVVDVPVRVYNFDNVLGFTMTVKSTNGVTAKIESITPVGLNGLGIGSYEVLNTTTGTIVWFNTSPVTLPDATVIFTLKVRLSGNTGASTALEITGDPASIAAEQIINGVETAVVPITINGSVCLSSTVNISGRITREDNVGVGNVTVQLSGGTVQTAITDTQGNYSFNGLTSGSNYTVTPVKDINDKNGLATSDLVVIQRQLAGIAPISTPYKRIAADPTNNKLIGLSDLSSIQRLIGGIELAFPLNTSWRFVDKNWVFANPSNPWLVNFPEILSFSNVTSNITNADFIGIKIGDPQISNNPQNAGSNELDERQEDILLEADENPVEMYGKIYIPVRAVHDCELEGIQFTLVCDKPSLVFKSVTSDILTGFGKENYGRPIGYEDALTIVWATPTGLPVHINEGTVVFWLELEQTGSSELRTPQIRMVSEPTQALATVGNNIDQKIGMRFNTRIQKSFRHYITPNPMTDHGALILEVPNGEFLDVMVTNSNGQQVLVKKNFYEAGTHVISLDDIDIYGSQVLFYQIIGETSFGSGKIVILKN